MLFTVIRGIGSLAHNFYATFGICILAGAAVALGGTYAFAELAGHVRSGATQRSDDAVLRWISEHRSPAFEPAMLEITFVGTGTVVLTMVAVSGLFLRLTKHRFSAILLGIATVGGIILNGLPKVEFGRYPSDVIAGVIIGLAWAGFCMATLEAIRLYGRNRAPQVERNDAPPPGDVAARA